jgi:hypothetical protein
MTKNLTPLVLRHLTHCPGFGIGIFVRFIKTSQKTMLQH